MIDDMCVMCLCKTGEDLLSTICVLCVYVKQEKIYDRRFVCYVFFKTRPCKFIVANTCIGGSSVFETVSSGGQRYNLIHGFEVAQIRVRKEGEAA
jgi:hypothetical protein